MSDDLERLYQDAKAALAAKDYHRARDLFQQVAHGNRGYKDSARLLVRATKLANRRKYNHLRLWAAIGGLLLIGLGICFLPWLADRTSKIATHPIILPTTSRLPGMVSPATATLHATASPLPTPTTVPLTWKRISTGQEFERDTVTALIFDPQDPVVLYVGMEHTGIFKSTDGGLSWWPAHQGLANAHITSLFVDFQNSHILYAGTMGGIYKTEDGGETWRRTGEGTHMLMDPQDSTHLYARNTENIYESTDQGNRWKTVYSTQAGCPDKIRTWAIHPLEGKTLFITGGEACEPGLYLSGDGGKTWTLEEKGGFCTDGLMIGLDRLGKYHVANHCAGEYAFLIPLPTFDQLYSYWKGDSRLFKESLNGEQRLILGRPEVGFVTVLAISPEDPATLYVGGDGIAVSNNGGLTWSKLNNGLGSTILHLESSLGNPDNLYLSSGNCEGAIIEFGGDKKWNITQPLFYSMNGGSTWDLSNQVGCYLIKDADGFTLYRIGTPGRGWETGLIWRSPDNGNSWEKILTPHQVITLTADKNQSGFLYLYTPGTSFSSNKYFVSGSYGHKWRTKDSPSDVKTCYGSTLQFIDAYRPMAIDPSDGNHVFVIENKVLLESHDSCETTNAFVTAPNTSMNSIAFDPKYPGTLYAGTDEGAYISFDSGQTWYPINDGLLGETVVYSIVADKDGNVYAATPYGIFKLEGSID